jgi:hypothetical protein
MSAVVFGALNLEVNMRKLIPLAALVVGLGMATAGTGYAATMNYLSPNPLTGTTGSWRSESGIPANPSQAKGQQAQQQRHETAQSFNRQTEGGPV